MTEQICLHILKSVFSKSHNRILKRGERDVLVWDDECKNWLKGASPIAIRAVEVAADGNECESGNAEAQGNAAIETGISKSGREIRGRMAKPSKPVGGDKEAGGPGA